MLNISTDMIYVFIIIGLVMVALYITISFIDLLTTRKQVNNYVILFKERFEQTKDIRMTMKHILAEYPSKSRIAKALTSGLYYLDTSIMKDYHVALKNVEDVFQDKKIVVIHNLCIEQTKQNKMILLEKKGE